MAITHAYQLAAQAAKVVPAGAGLFASKRIAELASLPMREQRQVIERNLRRVIGPDVSDAKIKRLVTETFASYAQYYHESFRLPSLSADEVDARIRYDGIAHVEASQARGNGTILAMPHLGGWEWAGFWLTMVGGYQVSAVVEALEPPELFEWFRELRASLGINVIPLDDDAGAATIAALKDNHILVLMSDRFISGGGVEVEFFGERTWLPAGPATLALRTGADLIPAAVYFDGADHFGHGLAPLSLERQGKFRADVTRITQELAGHLEDLIRVEPQQWHLLQPNWPSDFEALGRRSPYPD